MGEQRDFTHFIDDIIESIHLIEVYKKGLSEEEFNTNTLKQDAIIRRIEIIGEAVKNLPPEITSFHREIPWKKIAGLRDVAIHHYFGIIPKRLWQIITNDLPVFKEQILLVKSRFSN